MVEVSLTVGKLDASLALLLTKDHHLIEFPTILLPNGVKAGSIVKIRCDRDLDTELEEKKQFQAIQDEIINTFGKNLPKAPQLRVKNVTQTSCVLEWDDLDLGTASLKNLVLFRDGKKLGAIPSALTNKTTKLSGLPIDKSFKFHLRLDTTAGVYKSEEVEVTTHKMTDLSGITVCLGDITANDQFTVDDIQAALKNMGAHHPAQSSVKVDTTHFITTRENKQNPEFVKANEMNIPIIRPEWLKACERERRIVGVRDFYVKDCSLPEIFARNYWQNGATKSASDTLSTEQASPSGAPVVKVTAPSPDIQSQDETVKEVAPVEDSSPAAEPEQDEATQKVEASETKASEPEAAKTELPATSETREEPKPEAVGEVEEVALSEEKELPKSEEPAVEEEADLGAPAPASEESKVEEPAEEPKAEETKAEEPSAEEPVAAAVETPAVEEAQEAKEEIIEPPQAEKAIPATDLSEVDLNETNPESGVAEHTDLAEDLAASEAKEVAASESADGEALTEINLDENNDDEGEEDDSNEDTNDNETKSDAAPASTSSKSKSSKKKNKKKKKN